MRALTLRQQKLRQAISDYWSAQSTDAEKGAYYRILLYGGQDGYGRPGLRRWLARMLRTLAAIVEGY